VDPAASDEHDAVDLLARQLGPRCHVLAVRLQIAIEIGIFRSYNTGSGELTLPIFALMAESESFLLDFSIRSTFPENYLKVGPGQYLVSAMFTTPSLICAKIMFPAVLTERFSFSALLIVLVRLHPPLAIRAGMIPKFGIG